MSNEERTRELEKHVIERQETYDQLPASSTEHDQVLHELEDALHHLAEHTGTSIEQLILDLEHRYMLNISY